MDFAFECEKFKKPSLCSIWLIFLVYGCQLVPVFQENRLDLIVRDILGDGQFVLTLTSLHLLLHLLRPLLPELAVEPEPADRLRGGRQNVLQCLVQRRHHEINEPDLHLRDVRRLSVHEVGDREPPLLLSVTLVEELGEHAVRPEEVDARPPRWVRDVAGVEDVLHQERLVLLVRRLRERRLLVLAIQSASSACPASQNAGPCRSPERA